MLFSVIILISVLVLSVNIGSEKSVIPAMADVTARQTVIIDAGHGGFDGGAVALDGTSEKDINLSVALDLEAMLRLGGYDVIMIRDTDRGIESETEESISKRKISDMKNRLEIINSNTDAIFISIHQNKFSSTSVIGAQVFYSPNREESKVLAETIQSSFKNRLQPDNERVVKKGDKSIYLLYNAKIPAIIVECGFLSNKSELELLKSEEYQKKVAFTIYCGLLEYLSEDA